MGFAKRQMEEAWGRGYSSLEGLLCSDCIHDADLTLVHARQAHSGRCTFCAKSQVPVVSAEVMQEWIMDCLLQDHEQLDDAGVPFDSREGGYLIEHQSGYELVMENVDGVVAFSFLEALADAASDSAWVTRDWALLSPLARMEYGWEDFCRTVRHHLRFAFVLSPESDAGHPDSVSPSATLKEIADLVESLGLIRVLPRGSEWIRVRLDEKDWFDGLEDVGAPPARHAKSNRMSPAGISMLYASAEYETAVSETWDGNSDVRCTKARLATTRDITVVDLTRLPPVPGYWSNPGRRSLAVLRFMHGLAREISAPVSRNTSVDLHYAPTQVVSEFLLKAQVLDGTGDQSPLHGIIFASSYSGVANIALDVGHLEDKGLVTNMQNEWVELIDVERVTLAAPEKR